MISNQALQQLTHHSIPTSLYIQVPGLRSSNTLCSTTQVPYKPRHRKMPHAIPRTHLSVLGKLPALDVTTVENLSPAQKEAIVADTAKICRKLLEDMGVPVSKWKPQPIDAALRQRTISWIKDDLEPITGPVNKAFLMTTDAGLTYTERVYEGGDFETKCSMVKYISVAIYLDDLIDKRTGMAKEAESFLFKALQQGLGGGLSGSATPELPATPLGHDGIWLDQYRQVSIELARHMSDPLVSNMLLHSCTLYIEGCALEYYIQQDQTKYFLIQGAETELARDAAERRLAEEEDADIPLPLDADRVGTPEEGDVDANYLVPNGWPAWLRERSAVAETFAITSFRAPGGIDVPTWLWVTSIVELRNVILTVNDLVSFPKELLGDDTTSAISVQTKERRQLGMPGTAPDGGWCLRDSFEEVFGKSVRSAARINRLLRPSVLEARYGPDGQPYSIAELVDILKSFEKGESPAGKHLSQGEVMKALTLRLWETHQRGYVAWHFESERYRTFELFDWVKEMMGTEAPPNADWLLSCFPDA
ncbi:hypothetical protein V8F20_008086 [Naviculisporaceae sp. PSN 640]